ncbi:MAG TPA: hypothetical protein VK721_08135 [Solirubrobacteraceae bacterium]|jgi:hypothetical protein|nr:hypothetical protein [Solirubrobacteraceae bacterium]
MISSEVQRTLVKSPPELWAELSDPAALARHLGELGEIRIVRTEPERVVEWAAEHATGVVSIKPSGWGTRVTLSATRERAAEPEAAGATRDEPDASDAAAQPDTTADPEPDANPEPATAPKSATEPEAAADVEVAAAAPDIAPVSLQQPREPEPRRGIFARLFRRRSRTRFAPEEAAQDTGPPELDAPAPAIAESGSTQTQTLAVEPSPERPDAFAAVRQVLAPETFAATHPFAAQAAAGAAPAATQSAPAAGEEREPQALRPPDGEPSSDIAAELMAAEDVTADEVSAAEVTAVLTAVLDRLGAAHHRPFSRG